MMVNPECWLKVDIIGRFVGDKGVDKNSMARAEESEAMRLMQHNDTIQLFLFCQGA